MKLAPAALQHVVSRTLEHYHRRAEAFWEGARHHDVEQNIEALLRHIQAIPPFMILDKVAACVAGGCHRASGRACFWPTPCAARGWMSCFTA